MTLSLKNTIPTLALLVAILMMSGCGAADKLASDAKDAADRFGDQLRKLVASLPSDDPCKGQNTLFGDLTRCDSPQHKSIREAQCTFEFDAGLCGPTLRRVCEENINSPLCTDRGNYGDQQTLGRMFVDESDWRAGFLDEYKNVIAREESPQPDVNQNLFLANLTSATRYSRTSIITGRFDDEHTPSQKAEDERIFTIEDDAAGGTLTLADTQVQRSDAHPVFHGFKGITGGVETNIGNRNNGVSFVAGQFNLRSNCTDAACVVHRYYAGIHENTDLGAPLTAAPVAGTWKGLLRTVGLDELTSMPFDLDITFRRSANSGTIKANFDVVNGDNTDNYDIDATFDRFGAVEGDITIIGSKGTISGIIGQEGLVAAFISIETGVREATDPVGYAGGFVAYLPNSAPVETSTEIPDSAAECVKDFTCVDYAHWVGVASPTDTPTKDQFLRGTETGLAGTIGGDTGEGAGNLASPGLRAGGEAEDGFAIYRPFRTGEVHNVGILSTTNLGAPLTSTISSAQWPGLLHERSRTDAITMTPITLNIDFSADAGSGTINGKNGVNRLGLYEVAARFSDRGVITGTIVRTNKPGEAITGANTGAITGLIGAEGVVAVFRNHGTSKISFVGGFVARPPLTVNYAQWVTAASPTDTPMPNQFLKGTRNGLVGISRPEIGGLLSTAANANTYSRDHKLVGDAGDGFAIYRVKDGAAHNAGILSTTDLGAPLSGTITNALWLGSLQDRVGTGDTISSNITLNVNFDAGTKAGTITGINARRDYSINARFNNFGVIRGTISYTATIPGTNTITGGGGPIRGLIGADGAVAVFHSTMTGTSFVGGFVAQPAPVVVVDACVTANTCVDYAHWVAAVNPTDTPTPNQFLKGRPTGLTGTVPTDVANLDITFNTAFYGLSGGDAKDGFGVYRPRNPHSSGSLHNVGIHSTTRLGAPLRGTFTNASWAGTLRYRVEAENSVKDVGVTLKVGFNAGTQAGTITSGNVGTDYEIDATFNNIGVISGGITRRVAGDTSTGVVSGLIGQEGAIGVFHSTAGQTTSYVGGFLASPPAPNG